MPYFFYGIGNGGWGFLIAIMLLSTLPQMLVRAQFSKYSRVPSDRRITGAQVAAAIMRDNGISAAVQHVGGTLSDHYNPRTNTLGLSSGVYDSASVAALGIAAHEVGHLMQKESGYVPLKIRTAIVPVVNLGSMLAMPLFLIGIIMGMMNLAWLGILLFCGVLAFQLVTLPVEFNASRRAMEALTGNGYISEEELPLVRKVLSAAALTYVAAALASLLQILRLVGMTRRK